jgi:hypothetical protein
VPVFSLTLPAFSSGTKYLSATPHPQSLIDALTHLASLSGPIVKDPHILATVFADLIDAALLLLESSSSSKGRSSNYGGGGGGSMRRHMLNTAIFCMKLCQNFPKSCVLQTPKILTFISALASGGCQCLAMLVTPTSSSEGDEDDDDDDDGAVEVVDKVGDENSPFRYYLASIVALVGMLAEEPHLQAILNPFALQIFASFLNYRLTLAQNIIGSNSNNNGIGKSGESGEDDDEYEGGGKFADNSLAQEQMSSIAVLGRTSPAVSLQDVVMRLTHITSLFVALKNDLEAGRVPRCDLHVCLFIDSVSYLFLCVLIGLNGETGGRRGCRRWL